MTYTDPKGNMWSLQSLLGDSSQTRKLKLVLSIPRRLRLWLPSPGETHHLSLVMMKMHNLTLKVNLLRMRAQPPSPLCALVKLEAWDYCVVSSQTWRVQQRFCFHTYLSVAILICMNGWELSSMLSRQNPHQGTIAWSPRLITRMPTFLTQTTRTTWEFGNPLLWHLL